LPLHQQQLRLESLQAMQQESFSLIDISIVESVKGVAEAERNIGEIHIGVN
jgi:hypothetical protein